MACRSSILTLLHFDLLNLVLLELPQADLYSLCLVSKHFKELAEVHLYSTLRWKWHEDLNLYPTHRWPSQEYVFPPIIPFLNTILRYRPALAAYVNTVDLRGPWNNIMWSGSDEHPETGEKLIGSYFSQKHISHSDQILVEQEVDGMGVDSTFAAKWKLGLAHRHMDAFVALLISRLSNLQYFFIDGNFVQDNSFLSMMFKSALIDKIAGLPRFQSLKEVRHAPLCIKDHYEGVLTTQRKIYFHLPAVETLLVGLDQPLSDTWTSDLDMVPTLKHLKLAQCRESRMRQLLRHTPMLISFSWEFFWVWQSGIEQEDPPILNYTVLQEALSPFYPCLRDLSLTARHILDAFNDYDTFEFKGTLQWIKSFTRLQSLVLEVVLLTSTMSADSSFNPLPNWLPDSLQTLELQHELAVIRYDRWKHDSGTLVEACVDYFHDVHNIYPDLQLSLSITDLECELEETERKHIERAIEKSTFEAKLTEHRLYRKSS